MSIHVLSWVFQHSSATLGQRLVLLALADYAHDDGSKAFPSVESLAGKARMSPRGVREALRKLEAGGYVESTGVSPRGTTVYRVVMGAEVSSAPEVRHVRGRRNPAGSVSSTSADPSKDPSGDPPTSARANGKKILAPAEEPMGFSEWLGHHVVVAGALNLSMSVPKAGTSYRSGLARSFAALQGEGYSKADFELASEGVLSDDYMRLHGHVKPENVLRKEKIGGRIENGRLWRAKKATTTDTGAKYGFLDG